MTTISTTVAHSVTLGNFTYTSPLTITSTGYIRGGVYAQYGNAFTVINLGTIEIGIGYNGSSLLSNGNVTNAGLIGQGVQITGTGTVTNTGTMGEGGAFAAGILVRGGGTVFNSGTIFGSSSKYGYGIAARGAANVTNTGTIVASGPQGVGVDLAGRGAVLNSGTIIGGNVGVEINRGTLVDSGTIVGGSDAVYFSGVGNRLVLDAGSALGGMVVGDKYAATTLELAAGVGTGALSGLGTKFLRFPDIVVDVGAQWILSGGNTIGNGGLLNDAGTLINAGSLNATVGQLAIDPAALSGVTLINDGAISGAVTLAGSAYLQNAATIIAAGDAVFDTSGANTIVNSGTINGTGAAGVGIYLSAGGGVTNAAGGLIEGGDIGVWAVNTAATITNAGTVASLTGFGLGIDLQAGGSVTNASGRLIEGGEDGVEAADTTMMTNNGVIIGGFEGVLLLAGGTVVDAGTISGASAAINFAGGSGNRLVLDPGYRLAGPLIVQGSNNALEFASTASVGTLTGLGTNFTNFATVTVDAGAQWTLSGANTIGSGVTLADGGSLIVAGSLYDQGVLTATGAFYDNGRVVVGPAGTLAGAIRVAGGSVEFQGAVGNSAMVAFGTSGTLTIDDLASGSSGVQTQNFFALLVGLNGGNEVRIATSGLGEFTGIDSATAGAFDVGNDTTPLLLSSGDSLVATLTLEGDYDGQAFSVSAPSGGFVTVAVGPDVTPPTLVNDTGASVAAGAAVTVTASMLRFDDNVSSHAQETYTVITPPADGTLLRNGVAATSFTQADIDNGLLSYHETAAGVSADSFTFTVTDAAGNATADEQFQFQIAQPDVTPPTLVNDTGASVAAGAAVTVTASMLRFDDNVSSHAQETYTVITPPADGTLLRNGVAATSFTQADIDNGLLSYHETAAGVSADSFTFTVTDAAGNATADEQFQFQIAQPDVTPPTLVNDTGASVAAGAAVTVTASMLRFDDNVSSHAQETYTVSTPPADGTLLRNGVAATSFTQADIDNGLLSYHETAAGVSADSFTFTVTDAAGNATADEQFQFQIAQPDVTPPTLVNDTGASVAAGAAVTVTASMLRFDDNVSSHAQETYTVSTPPADGTLLRNGVAATSFTQADIDNGLLSYHETAAGVSADSFTFTVTDAAGNATADERFQFQIAQPDVTPPTLVNDTGASVAAGAAVTVTASMLRFDDNVSSHAQETYTVITPPADGTLLRNGVAATSFTQADIDNGLLSYHETAAGVSADSFTFTVTDAAGNATADEQFQFQIAQPDVTPPTLVNDTGASVAAGAAVTVTASMLRFDDNVSSHAQETYTVSTPPADGTLLRNGVAATSFTQADIDNGLLSYHETAAGVSADSFTFTVTDAAGNATADEQFQFQIAQPDVTPPTLVNDTGASVAAGAAVTVTASMLRFDDNVSSHAQETYTVITPPADGTLLRNGVAATSFTQADIDNGLLSYHETAAGASADSFTFTVTDAAGNATADEQFAITVGSPQPAFAAPQFVLSTFGASPNAGGWGNQATYPVAVGDVNGDGMADIVGFGASGVYVSLATGGGNFAQPIVGINAFGANAGWGNQNAYPLELGDVTGNGRADIVGFGSAGVYVSLSNGNGTFAQPILGINAFGAAGGWGNQSAYPLELGGVTGNGREDIVGLGSAGVYVSLANGDGTFAQPIFALNAFGAAGGWGNQSAYPVEMGDVTGNGRDDIVGFGSAGVYVSLANGDGTFAQPILALNAFGAAAGWGNQQLYPIELADVLGNGRDDIVAFGSAGVYVALANGDGTFAQPTLATGAFGAAGGWSSQNQFPRLLGDVNGDKRGDIVGFGSAGVYVSLSQPQVGAGFALS